MKEQKLIRMKVENFEGVQKIELSFSDEITVISGKNRAGKTSLINAFIAALGGSKMLKLLDIADPVRKGTHEAKLEAELSDFRIERVFKRDVADKLYVYHKRDDLPETEMKAPQSFLNQFINMFQDPILFQNLDGAKRNELFLEMLGIADDIKKLEDEHKVLYTDRRAINRVGKTLESTLKGMPEPEDNLPDEFLDATVLSEQLEEINELSNEKVKLETELTAVKDRYEGLNKIIEDAEADIKKLQEKIAETKESQKALAHKGKDIQEKLTGLFIPEKEGIKAGLADINETNKKITYKKNYVDIENQLGDNQVKAGEYTTKLEENIKARERLFKNSKFPIKELGYDSQTGITYKGIPYDQLSTEEQSSVSAQIAMVEREHNIKVLILRNASNYTEESFEAIKKEAIKAGYQLIVEKPGTAELEAVIIENGKLKE